MFISKPSFRARISNWTVTPGAIYWEAMEIGLAQVWFMVTVGHFSRRGSKGKIRILQEGSTTFMIIDSQKVVDMTNDPSETDKVISVLAVIPPVQSKSPDWEMRKVQAIWRYQPPPDDEMGRIPYDAIEIEGGVLVPSFPIGEPVERERLALVVRIAKELKS